HTRWKPAWVRSGAKRPPGKGQAPSYRKDRPMMHTHEPLEDQPLGPTPPDLPAPVALTMTATPPSSPPSHASERARARRPLPRPDLAPARAGDKIERAVLLLTRRPRPVSTPCLKCQDSGVLAWTGDFHTSRQQRSYAQPLPGGEEASGHCL